MPSLTLNKSPQNRVASKAIESLPSSPSKSPPFSPITPSPGHPCSISKNATQTRFVHSQTLQTTIAPPSPKPINFHENIDVLALKSTISLLQLQKATATRDIRTLQRIKIRALQNPQEFARALMSGDIKTRSDPLFHPGSNFDKHDKEDVQSISTDQNDHQFPRPTTCSWEKLPAPQNIVRAPPINFAQYAIVPDSLDKLHSDQLSRPTEGIPRHIGPDGDYIDMGEGNRRECDMGVAAPYQPSRDKIANTSLRKSAK
ncbi:hypothetical protein GcM3_012046 [Golovinomyces cichoracearum]|uniref:Uncharacterized protein n=1 Tax=Golovinomyces cichoracearum TaxID=62708 RepID=A0A420J9R4_9PEZI|nr:hypothetical protein GcM3_012046 [Golovinomyces cichoracearum]